MLPKAQWLDGINRENKKQTERNEVWENDHRNWWPLCFNYSLVGFVGLCSFGFQNTYLLEYSGYQIFCDKCIDNFLSQARIYLSFKSVWFHLCPLYIKSFLLWSWEISNDRSIDHCCLYPREKAAAPRCSIVNNSHLNYYLPSCVSLLNSITFGSSRCCNMSMLTYNAKQ